MQHDYRTHAGLGLATTAIGEPVDQPTSSAPLLDEVLVIGTPGDERLIRFRTGELTIGRGLECDIVINTRFTSRIHARIVRTGDRFFFLEDTSRNGTFVTLQGAKPQLLRYGDRVPLVGYGIIGLGVRPDFDAPGTLRYSLARTALNRE